MTPRVLPIIAFVSLLVMLAAPHAMAQTPEFVVEGDRLQRIDVETGETLWTVRHPSLWKTKKRERPERDLLAPVSVEDRWFYSIGAWLVEIDADRGVIIERHHFPAKIVALGTKGELVEVTLEFEAARGGGDRETIIRYRPDSTAPRGAWWALGWHGPWKDVSYLAHPIGTYGTEFDESEHRDAIALLEKRKRQEPGNPFYDFFLGSEYDRIGNAARAAEHFEAAASNDAASWSSDVQLAMMFDELGQYDRGDVAFDRAMEKLDDVHPQFRNSWSLVAHAVLMGIWSREAIAEALAEKDFEAVDRMQTRVVRLFPYLEQSAIAWTTVADWYAEHDRPELAEKWREHARRAEKSPWIGAEAKEFDLSLPLMLGFAVAAWLAAFAIGLRTPERRRWKWLPKPKAGEVVGLVIVFVLPLPLAWNMVTAISHIGLVAGAPLEVMQESWGSPNVSDWLEDELTPGSARDRLLEHSKLMQAAHAAGKPEPPPIDDGSELLIAAVEKTASLAPAEELLSPIPVGGEPVELPDLELLIPPWAVLLAFLLVLGAATRAKFPRVARGLQVFIPGGATSAGPVTGLMAGLAIAALASILFGIDSILRDIAAPAFGKYYGLEANPGEGNSPSHAWAWIALTAVLAVHVLTLWLDQTTER